MNRFDVCFIFVASLLAGIESRAAEAANGIPQRDSLSGTNDAQRLDLSVGHEDDREPLFFDTLQNSASRRLVLLSGWADSFFGDSEYTDEEADAWASLEQNVKFYRNLDPEFRTRVRASVVMPNLNRRLRLSFEGNDAFYTDDLSELEEETLKESRTAALDDPSLRLQYFFLKDPDINLDISGGVRLSEPSVYTGPRLRLRGGIGSGWNTRFTQRAYWYTTNRLKSKSEMRFDHLIGKRNLFRQTFQVDWDEETHSTQGFRPSTTTSIAQPLSSNAAFYYTWSAAYRTRPDPRWTSTTLSIGYRQSVFRKWIIIAATPFVTWEEQYDWEPKAGLSLSFSIIFGQE